MKTFKISNFISLLAVGLVLVSCKDNILTPVNNTKSADSLVALINTLNTKLITVNAKDNTLQIQLAKFQSKLDSLDAVSKSNMNYVQSVQYTVYIIDGGNTVTGVYAGDRKCANCKVAGVDGATVTLYSNGQTYTAVSADGRAIFNNIYVAGLATVSISAAGYTQCSYTTYFNPNGASTGGVGSVSLYSSNFSGYSSSSNGVSPVSTNGLGSGATFNFVVASNGSVASVTVSNPGSGYKTGDLITFNGVQLCDCNGSLTYSVTTASNGGVNTTGATLNASTNVLIVPTAGKNVTTYTGHLYINKSTVDDTLGRLYNNATDAARYKTFISPMGPYHGPDYTSQYSPSDYTQNQYYNVGNITLPPGTAIGFTSITTLAGINFIYGYPTYLNTYYSSNNTNYQYLPGDIISITYTGLTAFAVIDGSGNYVMNVPSYQNNPGTTVGAAATQASTGGNVINYQDSYTYLSSNNYVGSTNPTLKYFDNTTYAVTPITTFYQVTQMFEFNPYIELDNGGGYGLIGGGNYGYTQTLSSYPGQSLVRNIFFFAVSPTGQ